MAIWSECPDCKGQVYEIRLGRKGPWSIEQICCRCGVIGHDQHFLAEEQRAATAAAEKGKAA